MKTIDLETTFTYKYYHLNCFKSLKKHLDKQGDIAGLTLLQELEKSANILVDKLDNDVTLAVSCGDVKIDNELEYLRARYTLNKKHNPTKAFGQLMAGLKNYKRK